MADVRVVHELGDTAAAWDELVAALPVPSPFLRSWWLDGTAGGRRTYVLAWEGGDLVGGLALDGTGPRSAGGYRMASNGPLTPDHLDLVAAPHRRAEVVGSIGGWLRSRVRVLLAEGLVAGSALHEALPEARSFDVGAAPMASLEGGADRYFGARRTRFVQNLRRDERRLSASGHHVELIPAVDALPALRRFRDLHAAQWGDASNFLSGYAHFERAALRGVERGEVAIYGLRGPAGLDAVEIMLHGSGRLSLYQGARVPELPGGRAVIYFDVIKRVCEAGYTELDLLRGDEPYKMRWADDVRRIEGLRWGRGVADRGLRWADRGLSGARAARQQVRQLRDR